MQEKIKRRIKGNGDRVDIEECEYTNTGSCEDCFLPEDKECPYFAEDNDIWFPLAFFTLIC